MMEHRYAGLILLALLVASTGGCGGCSSKTPPKRPTTPAKPVAKPATPAPKTPVPAPKTAPVAGKAAPSEEDPDSEGGEPKQPEGPKTEEVAEFPPIAEPATVSVELIPPESVLTPEDAVARNGDRMKRIVLALNAYAKKEGHFPAPAITSEEGESLLSWRVAILPLLGQEALYKQFSLKEPWDSPKNIKLLAKIPAEFQSPFRPDEKTNYVLPLGEKAIFTSQGGVEWKKLTDGWTQTIALLCLDDLRAVPWTKPVDFELKQTSPVGRLGQRTGGFFAAVASGETAWVPASASKEKLAPLFTIAGDKLALIDIFKPIETAVPAFAPPVGDDPDFLASLPEGNLFPEIGSSSIDFSASSSSSPSSKGPTTTEDNRAPIPDDEAKTIARKMLMEVFAKDIADLKDKYKREAEYSNKLASLLMENAERISAEPASYYILLETARDQAAKSGDYALAMQAGGILMERFKVNAIQIMKKTLVDSSAAKTTYFGKSVEQARTDAESLLRQAVDADDFETAKAAMTVYKECASEQNNDSRTGGNTASKQQPRKNNEHVERAKTAEKELSALVRAYQALGDAKEVLKEKPDDPEASLKLGKYLALAKAKWSTGLPYLAKGSDVKLRFMATLDLDPAPKNAKSMFELGSLYWDQSDRASPMDKRSFQMRAAFWYSKAVSGLPAGLDKVQAEKRIEETKQAVGDELYDSMIAAMSASAKAS